MMNVLRSLKVGRSGSLEVVFAVVPELEYGSLSEGDALVACGFKSLRRHQ